MQPVTLTTTRLSLRCPTHDDVEALTHALDDQRVSQWLARVPFPYHRHDAIRWVGIATDNWQRDTAYPFNAFLDRQLVGGIGITRVSDTDGVLGYWLVPDHWGQGLGQEMLGAIIGFAFDTGGFRQLTAGIHPDNDRSARLLIASGFTSIGDQIYLHPPADNRLQGPHYRLSVEDCQSSPAPE